jgi:RNA polymerase sigma-70 factor (ECF subfamily)
MLSEKEFLALITEHQNIVHKVCNMYADTTQAREDLFQEVLLNAWKGIKQFRGDSKFTTWLYRVALNTAITQFRKENRSPITQPLPQYSLTIADEPFRPDERVAVMYQAINKLSKIDKALVLLYLEDYGHAEIGEMLGITANNVAVKLNRVKTKLKEFMNAIN